jgi:hypothetical protein
MADAPLIAIDGVTSAPGSWWFKIDNFPIGRGHKGVIAGTLDDVLRVVRKR